jgi:septal ring factor EnvC (AmiA/AmiB activator)
MATTDDTTRINFTKLGSALAVIGLVLGLVYTAAAKDAALATTQRDLAEVRLEQRETALVLRGIQQSLTRLETKVDAIAPDRRQ